MKKVKNLAALVGLNEKSTNTVKAIPVNDIESKRQVRVHFENIEELAESFKTEGQQTPITVTGPNSVGMYTILRGERRWRAAKLAGFETIDALVSNKDQSQSDVIAGQLVENIQRENLNALEIAQSLQELSDAGWNNRKIAKRLGKSDSYVSEHLSLNKLPDEIKKLNYQGYVTDRASLYSLRRIYELDPDKTFQIVKEIEENKGISRNQIRKYVAEIQNPNSQGIAPSLTTEEQQQNVQAEPITESFSEPQHVQDTSLETDLGEPVNEAQPISEVKTVVTKQATEPPVEPNTAQGDYAKSKVQKHPVEDLGALNVGPFHFAVDVLVTTGDEDYIGQLLIGFVSQNKNKAWVSIEGTPMEVEVSAISIMEVRDTHNEN